MTDTLHQKRLLLLCEELLELPAPERERALDVREDISAQLRADVMAMLGNIDRRDDKGYRTVHPFEILGQQGPQTGDDVGRWRLEEELGSGGMGVVFRARRRHGVSKQRTALKLLRAQIVTQAMRVRFNAEREILARLRHPYIAGLVDGGSTDDGIPWIAMELVEGVRINEYCDDQRLTVDERLALLEKVAGALQHAHQNLVIHRDIKPSNILVTSDGIPKLVDFGIAKLLEEGGEHGSSSAAGASALTTQFGATALTPDYASPEQILRGDISTASDIYSLGIVALQLLTGNLPYALGHASADQMVRLLESTTTPQASAMFSNVEDQDELEKLALQRRTSIRRLRKQLGGDLEVVLAKATHREVERRYGSAQTLAADLYAIRQSQPVSARKDSLGYRAWSLVRVNRLAVSVVGATVVALSLGLAAALWQARIANERFNDLHQFARVVISEIYDEVSDLPGSMSARRRITTEAQHYLDRLIGMKLTDDELIGDLSFAYRRLADVQGWPSNANLGQSEAALANYQKASELLTRLEVPTPENRREQAQILRRSADVLAWQGFTGRALDQLHQSLALLEELYTLDPLDSGANVNLGYNLINLGDKSGHPSFQNVGDPASAVRYYKRAISLLAQVTTERSNRELQRCYAVALERAGTMALSADELAAALRYFGESRDIRERLARAHPDHSNIQRDAGIASESLAKVYRHQGNLEAAITAFEKALQVYRQLADIDAQNASAQRTVAIGQKNLADTLILQGNETAARRLYVGASDIMRTLLEKDPSSERLAAELADIDASLVRE